MQVTGPIYIFLCQLRYELSSVLPFRFSQTKKIDSKSIVSFIRRIFQTINTLFLHLSRCRYLWPEFYNFIVNELSERNANNAEYYENPSLFACLFHDSQEII